MRVTCIVVMLLGTSRAPRTPDEDEKKTATNEDEKKMAAKTPTTLATASNVQLSCGYFWNDQGLKSELDQVAKGIRPFDYLLQHKELVPPTGLILEFGVFRGESIRAIGNAFPTRRVDGFDAFRGLPERWQDEDGKRLPYFIKAGAFSLRGRQPINLPVNVHLWKGWFNQTLEEYLDLYRDKVALVHIDCDIFSSTLEVLKRLASRLRPGTIVLFDELINYDGWKRHEVKAARMVFSEHRICLEPLATKSPMRLDNAEMNTADQGALFRVSSRRAPI